MCIEKRILFVIFRASNKRKDHKSGITPTSVSVEEVDFGTVLQRISTSQVGARIRGVQLGRHLWSLNKASLWSKPVKSHEDIKKSVKRLIPEQEAQQESRIQGPLSLLLAWTTLSSPPQPKTHRKTRLTSPRSVFRDTCPKRLGCCCCMSREREMQSERDPGAPLKEIESIFPEICSTSSARQTLETVHTHH